MLTIGIYCENLALADKFQFIDSEWFYPIEFHSIVTQELYSHVQECRLI